MPERFEMFDQVIAWGGALKALRRRHDEVTFRGPTCAVRVHIGGAAVVQLIPNFLFECRQCRQVRNAGARKELLDRQSRQALTSPAS